MKRTSIWILCLSLLCLTVPCRADGETKPYDFGPPARKRGPSNCVIRRDTVGLDESGKDLHLQFIEDIHDMPDTAEVSSGPFFSIPIQEGASPSGGKTYDILIVPASGAKGVPSITLNYNSQAGNGAAGFGWNIGGLSAITISNRNHYYNGVVSPADIADTSAFFCLDGEAIVPDADSLLFPTYRYETARSRVKIRKHVSGGIVTHFSALYPDGSRAVFGDSLATEARSSFPLMRLSDKEGYVTLFSYDHPASDNNYYLTGISYGSQGIGQPQATMSFSWAARADTLTQYCAGERIRLGKILKTVNSFDGDSLILSYSLTHSNPDGYSLFTRLDCSRTGESANPLVFWYGGNDTESSSSPEPTDWTTDTNYVSEYFNVWNDYFIFLRGKYVRNTFSDGLAVFPARPYFAERFQVGTSKYFGSGYTANESLMLIPSVRDEKDVVGVQVGTHVVSIATVDVDEDSSDEIVCIREVDENMLDATKHYSVKTYKYSPANDGFVENYFNLTLNGSFSTGTLINYYSANQRSFFYGDFRGDGTMQVAAISYSENEEGYYQTPYTAVIDLGAMTKLSDEVLFSSYTRADSCNVFALDIDSDGCTELCRATATGLELYHLTPEGTFSLFGTITGLTSAELTVAGRRPSFTDLNADGYIDIAVCPLNRSAVWDLYSYTGRGFVHSTFTAGTRYGGDEYVFLDLSGDGLPELNKVNGNDLYSYKNIAGRFSSGMYDRLGFNYDCMTVPVNALSYNAASSFFTVEGAAVKTYSLRKNWQKARALTRVRDSFGNVTLNSYAMMGDTDVYRVDETIPCDNAAGFADIAAPLLLLRSSDSYASGSKMMLSSKYYDYSNAVAHQFGLGFCGFRKIRCTNYLSPGNHGRGLEGEHPVVTVQTFDPQRMGVPLKQVSTLGFDGSTLSDMEYTWDNRSTMYGKLNPRLTATTQTDSLAGLVTVTSYTYDSHDCPVLTETVRTNELGDTKKDSVCVTYSHQYSSDHYILGTVLEQKNTRRWHDGDTTVTWVKTVNYEADSIGRVTSKKDYAWHREKRWPNPGGVQPQSLFRTEGGGLVNEDRYHYDAFGNVDTLRSYSHGATTPLVSSYTYDQSGRQVLSSTNPLGLTTTYSGYSAFGKPGTVTDARGRATITTFDNWGDAVRTDYADGTWETRTTAWDSLGRFRVSTLNSAGQQSVAHIDPAGRTIRSGNLHFDGRWIVSDREYDAASGLVTRESLPHPSDAPDSAIIWNIISYDRFGRDSCIVAASGVRTTAVYNRSVTSIMEGNITTTRTVDADGRVILVNDPSGNIVNTVRPDGQLDRVSVHNGVVTTFAYDAFGSRYMIVDPSLGTQTDTTVWNADGSSLTTTTNSYGTTKTTVDRFGRVTQVQQGVGLPRYRTIITSSYDAYGRLTSSVSNKGPSVTYTYDAYDRPLTIVEKGYYNYTFTKAYSYGADGTLASTAYSTSLLQGTLATENYSYANGVLYQTALADGTIVSRIDAENDLGIVTLATTPHGVQRHYSYTPAGLPVSRSIGAATEDYSWTATSGDLFTRSFNPGSSPLQPQWDEEQFLYDMKGRLVTTEKTGPGFNVSHSNVNYDTRDNISSIGGAATMQYATAGKPYTMSSYTAANSDNQRLLTINYNEAGRPTRIYSQSKRIEVTIDYGALGQRSLMTVTDMSSPFFLTSGQGAQPTVVGQMEETPDAVINPGLGTELFSRHYFDGGRMDADIMPIGAKTVRLYLGGGPYSAPAVLVSLGFGTPTVYNIWRDHLGSVRAIGTDSTSVSYFSYDSWGRPRDPESFSPLAYDTAVNTINRGFTGHEYLPWFGLYNANARLYDPLLGRFLSPDPYIQNPALSQNYNRFAYCLNIPLRYKDESGEFLGTIITFLARAVVLFGATVAYNFVRIFDENKANKLLINAGDRFFNALDRAIQIDAGLFKFNSGQKWYQKAWTGLSRFTWEAHQTVLGNTVSHIRNNLWNVNVEHYRGVTLVNREGKGDRWAFTLGSYINSNKVVADPKTDMLFAHEFGHTRQSKILGPTYLYLVGRPSIVGCALDNIGLNDHDNEWYEVWANQLSHNYFEDKDYQFVEQWDKHDADYPRRQHANWYFYITLSSYFNVSIQELALSLFPFAR